MKTHKISREDAKRRIVIEHFSGDRTYSDCMGIGMVKELIDYIYNSLDEECCANCIYWYESEKNLCLNGESILFDIIHSIPEDEICNKFKGKEDETNRCRL